MSYITQKDLEGTKRGEAAYKDDTDVPYEEKEIAMKIRRLAIDQKSTEARFREQENERKFEERQKLFNLFKQDDEARQPGFIKQAQLFMTEETQNNIRELEHESKKIIDNLGLDSSEEKKYDELREELYNWDWKERNRLIEEYRVDAKDKAHQAKGKGNLRG